ncbi:Smr/MutS family protein [Thermodesulfatator atlanticus]|uniref:Smr/MutS family protein n=1 Tax=Thermodesulfatator atlanticus TaxID=501497 RepID=UPI0003B62BB3|nr:Smr/MutS family protein [Thermodesulfatator atlanticus]
MESKKGFNCPFETLAGKIKKETLPEKVPPSPASPDISFEEAMTGVKKIPGREKIYWKLVLKRPSMPGKEEKIDVKRLLAIRVRDTSEYVEELVMGFQKELFDALHQGKISVARTLNLRRLGAAEAEIILEQFFKESLARGDHCILIIHGRGLSSKKEPVLKTKVHEWLKRGPYRKYVIGFCSARKCDGGPGATYVLLSHRPLKKQLKKRNNLT